VFLILHGWQGSGPDHWQTWLAGRLRERGETVRYPDLPDPGAPRLDAWLAALRDELAACPEPPVVVCHSLACLLWLHHGSGQRALLVAPPAYVPELDSFFPVPAPRDLDAEIWCADDDPFCPPGAGALYGEPLGLPVRVFAGGGHLNPDAGYGPWPAVESWASGAKKGVET
jgi:predicted alpha/beta hydrolase family esterase